MVKKIVNRFYRSLNMWASKTIWFENTAGFAGCKNILNNNKFDIEVANLGSSSGFYAFNYDTAGVKGLNLATPKQSLLADYEMIRNYFSFLKEGAVVIIPLCLFSALEGEDADFPDKYYVLLQSESIPHYSWKKKLQVMDIFNNPIKYLPLFCFPREVLRSLKKHKRKQLSKKEMDVDAKRWLDDWAKEFSIIDFNRPLSLRNQDSFKSAAMLLRNTIDFCISRNMKPVIVLPPVSKSLSVLYSNQVRKSLVTDFVAQGNVSKVPFLNYIDDEDFVEDDYYRNAFFMSKKGSEAFTKKVISDLREMQYLA